MSDCFQKIFSRAKKALNAQTNVAIAAPNRPFEERSALQPSIQPQETAAPKTPRAEDSVPQRGIQPRESAASNREREEDRAPQTSVQPDESTVSTRQREERTALQPSVHGAPRSTWPSTEGTKEFWTNFVTSLDAMEVMMGQ